MGRRAQSLCVVGLLVIQSGLLAYSAKKNSPTWDEVGHLAAGISHWQLGRFELYSVNPPLIRTIAAAPVALISQPQMDWSFYRKDPSLRSEVFVGRRMIEISGSQSLDYFFYARLAVIPIALLGGLLCFVWARDLFGVIPGIVALAIWTFSPSVLAYGSVITPDLGSAVALLGSSYLFWRWLDTPSWSWALALCGALALAMLTKSVWLTLPPLFFVIWAVVAIARKRREPSAPSGEGIKAKFSVWIKSPSGIQSLQLGTATFAAFLLVNGFYGFAGSFKPLGDYTFVSSTFTGNTPTKSTVDLSGSDQIRVDRYETEKGNRFKPSLLASLPVPLPENFVQGIDIQTRDFERGRYDPNWQSYLMGRWQQGGWWYYYIIGLLIKVPVAIWILVGLGSIAAWYWRQRDLSARLGLVCLWVPAVAFFVLVSSSTGLNRYVRYALPVLPVLFVWASQVGRYFEQEGSSRYQFRLAHGALFAVFGWLGIVSVSSAPHHLSYFNELAGGSERGHLYLCDSNIDWGQDLSHLQEWIDRNPETKGRLRLAYFGSFDPSSIGIEYQLPSLLGGRRGRNLAVHDFYSDGNASGNRLGPGWYVISKSYLAGHTMPVPDGRNHLSFKFVDEEAFARFGELTPVDRIGHSMLVYHVPENKTQELYAAQTRK